MRKDAVTLMELLIVIVIIGILAAIAVPIYTGKVERTRGERAIANIEMIKDAYKQYYIKNSQNPGFIDPTPLADLTAINTTFGLDLSDSDFAYSINVMETGTPNEYREIKAIRNGSDIKYKYDPTDGSPDEWDTASTWNWMP